jgi:GLPGLI family protein
MNQIIRVISLIFLVSILSLKAQCQGFSGVLKYQQITAFVDTAQKYAIPFELNFNQYGSYSRPIGDIRKLNLSDTSKIFVPIGYSREKKGNVVYIDFINKRMVSRQKADIEIVLVDDTLQPIDWQISNEQKLFGELRCQKATAFVRGRNYTAWFAPAIPIRTGPWKLHGLPGLIVEAYDDKGHVRFMFESVKLLNETTSIEPPQSYGQKIFNEKSVVEYANELIDKFHKFLNSQPGREGGNDKVASTGIEVVDYKK